MQEAVFSFLQTLGDPQELFFLEAKWTEMFDTFFLCQDSVVVLLDDAWCKVQSIVQLVD